MNEFFNKICKKEIRMFAYSFILDAYIYSPTIETLVPKEGSTTTKSKHKFNEALRKRKLIHGMSF